MLVCKSYRTPFFYSLNIVIYTALKDNRPVKDLLNKSHFFDLFKLFYIYFIFMQTDNTLLRAQSPAALAEEYIVRSIWDDVFPAGTNLPSERDLADKIGVTRTTLREVLQRLARDGWLTIQHGKPTKVNDIWDTAGPSIIETLITLDRQSAPLIIENMLSLRSRMSESYIYEAVKNSPKASVALFKG